MAPKNEVKFSILKDEKGTTYKGGYTNEPEINSTNSLINTYFNIDIQQSAYFTLLIEGMEYGRFHTQIEAVTPNGLGMTNGRRDYFFEEDPVPTAKYEPTTAHKTEGSLTYVTGSQAERETWIESKVKYTPGKNGQWQNFKGRRTVHWLPLKSLQYSQGSIEALSLATGTFSDLRLPFRKQSPTLTIEMYDHRSDFFEMKLREWHSETVLTGGFVPVLESIKRHVWLRGFSTNGDCNYVTECDCILIDDINTSRDYASNDLKVISFKLLIIGYGNTPEL